MTMSTVEVRLRLPNATLTQLRQMARGRATTEAAVITQALDLLARSGDVPVRNDYWFSVATMRQDWDAMPDDWMADEMGDASVVEYLLARVEMAALPGRLVQALAEQSLRASLTLATSRNPAIDLDHLRALVSTF